jgi:hypothetical protein
MDFEDWRPDHHSCLRIRCAINCGIIILVLATLGVHHSAQKEPVKRDQADLAGRAFPNLIDSYL